VINSIAGYTPDPSNKVIASINEVGFTSLWDVTVDISPLRTNPQFRQASIVTVDAPIGQMGNYHLGTPRPTPEVAVDQGAVSKTSTIYGAINAPCTDIDNGPRQVNGAWDIGADELPGAAGSACGGTAPPTMAPVLDNFNRRNFSLTNMSVSALGPNWSGTGGIAGGTRLTDFPPGITLPVPNDVTAQFPIVPFMGGTSSITMWRGPNSVLNANQEAAFTILSTENLPASSPNDGNVVWEGLVLKQAGAGNGTAYIEVRYSERLQRIEVRTTADNGSNFQVRATFNNVNLNPGDVFRAQALANGTVVVFNGLTQVGVANVSGWGAARTAGGGSVGMRFTVPALPRSVRIDDFRGGNL
jgi:hypothetical protein